MGREEIIMKVLVTGGGGFLGKSIVRRLLAEGYNVRSFSRSEYPQPEGLQVEQYAGDLADATAVKHAIKGCDQVFHVAAKAGVWGDPAEYYRTNVLGTENVIEACRLHEVKGLIYTSSPSVIFNGRDMEGVDETVPYPRQYHAWYPQTKAEAEKSVLRANDSTLATVALRPHLIWGPEDNHLVPRILERGRAGALRRVGRRNCLVDTVYIDNAAQAHIQAAQALAPGAVVAGKAYFIANDEPLPLWEVINRILAAGGLPPVEKTISASTAYAAGWLLETVYSLFRLSGEPPMTRFVAKELSTAHWFDLGAAKRDFAYAPEISVTEGMERLGQWLRQ